MARLDPESSSALSYYSLGYQQIKQLVEEPGGLGPPLKDPFEH